VTVWKTTGPISGWTVRTTSSGVAVAVGVGVGVSVGVAVGVAVRVRVAVGGGAVDEDEPPPPTLTSNVQPDSAVSAAPAPARNARLPRRGTDCPSAAPLDTAGPLPDPLDFPFVSGRMKVVCEDG
jgi:hypothetical protein